MKGYRFLKRKPVFLSEILKAVRKTALYLLNLEKMIWIWFYFENAFENVSFEKNSEITLN